MSNGFVLLTLSSIRSFVGSRVDSCFPYIDSSVPVRLSLSASLKAFPMSYVSSLLDSSTLKDHHSVDPKQRTADQSLRNKRRDLEVDLHLCSPCKHAPPSPATVWQCDVHQSRRIIPLLFGVPASAIADCRGGALLWR